ncbi:hypothetical protein CUR178_06745 [Leishmania enriettii]|uniref:ABC transmembrane type-1 domain-containing protein n=1 Tax=Leishmania enriettii TaxID=5663 RepID=A0A836KYM0_LEIEN|nr:hypothetical protein CUR178_06745 [Leishmania enriettii]
MAGAVAPINSILLGRRMNALANYQALHDREQSKNMLRTNASFSVIIAAYAFFGWLLQFFYGYAGERLTIELRTLLFKQILLRDMAFFETLGRDAGTLSGMLSGDCEAIHQLRGPVVGIRIQIACTVVVGIIVGFFFQ